MWAQASKVEVGLALAGFGMVFVAYVMYATHLLRGGLLRRPLERPAWPLAVAVGASVLWALFGFVDLLSSRVLSGHLALAFDHLRYAGWSLFLLLLLPARGGSWWRSGAALPVALVVASAASNGALAGGLLQPAAVLQALSAVQLAWAVSTLVLVEQVFRNQDESARWSAKPLCLGLACAFAYDLYLYAQAVVFGGVDADVLNARPLVHAAVVPLLLASSRRNAHWLARVRVSKAAAFYSASLLLIGGYLLFVAGAGYYVKYFGGTWGGALQVALMAAAVLALLVVMLSATQRARVRVFLGKHFFSYRYDYRVEWLRFTAMLSSRAAPQEVSQQVVRGLADLVECPAGSLWFKSASEPDYTQAASWNMPRVALAEPADSAFSRRLQEREWIIDFATDIDSAAGTDTDSKVLPPAWLSACGPLWIAVPLLVGDEMPGFVLLAPPRTPIDLDWEVRDLLKTAARQAASYLALMQATEALIETRKFDAFNRMSAFVVHDLKNVVTQLSLMLKNAERHHANPEFQQDMLQTVANALEKMKQLMLQLREGEKPEGVSSGVELVPILQRLKLAAERRGRSLQLEKIECLATRGHDHRLERVIDHVVQNALDATPPSGRVWITLQRAGGMACIVVGDTGVGMSADFIRDRLFRPFSSTKSHGMGIGAYESLQYLKALGGTIKVESTVGEGTEVTMTMPLFERVAGSDLLPDAIPEHPLR